VWTGLVPSTAVGIGLLLVAHFTDGAAQISLWGAALALDVLGPYLFGSSVVTLAGVGSATRRGASSCWSLST
jgi:low temperature requirement protein LtrA